MNISAPSLLIFFLILSTQTIAQDWQPLTGNNNPEDWTKLGGNAIFQFENGEIIGTTVSNSPNSFFATKKMYGDFILEFEILVDPALNSGVQIRSNSHEDYQMGRVHGYQVEIDPGPRAFSGGIYDEARRGWLYPLSRNEKGRKAFQNGIWNKVRVEAIGHYINTWINGVQCSRLVDDLTASGFIALQVHSIGKEEQAGAQVRWRNIRILENELSQYQWTNDPEVPEISFIINHITAWEKRKGWRLLWDGKSTDGWRSVKNDNFPANDWEIKDGELSVLASGGDIITREVFGDFELSIEFKISEGTDSGIKYFVDPDLNNGLDSAIGCEFQILDDQYHPDAKLGVNGNRTLASLYDLIPASNLNTPGRSKQFKGLNQWNHARIVSRNGKVEHWLNGEKAVTYDRYSQMFRALLACSKYQKWENFGQWPEGHILLQNHGGPVSYRSIKIREW